MINIHVRPGGVFIAGQDQDKLRGEYNPSESEIIIAFTSTIIHYTYIALLFVNGKNHLIDTQGGKIYAPKFNKFSY